MFRKFLLVILFSLSFVAIGDENRSETDPVDDAIKAANDDNNNSRFQKVCRLISVHANCLPRRDLACKEIRRINTSNTVMRSGVFR